MSDWEVVDDDISSDWEMTNPIQSAMDQQQAPKKESHGLRNLILGLGQSGIDWATGAPEQFKRMAQLGYGGPGAKSFGRAAEQVQQRLPDRPNLEQYASDTEGFSPFNIGRYGPDVLAAGYGVGQLGHGLYNSAMKYSNRSIGNKIVKDANDLQESFNHDYNRLLFNADDELARVSPKPPPIKRYEHDFHEDIPLNTKETIVKPGQKIIGEENLEKLKRGSDFDTNVKIQDFLEEPSIDSAHWGKASINELLREFEQKELIGKLTTAEKEARKAARAIKGEIESYMDQQFQKINPEFKQLYDQLTHDYLTEMGPYLGNRSVRAARKEPGKKGYIKPSRLPSKLYEEGGDPFMALMADKYPEIKLNRLLAKPFTRKALEKSALEDR